jgi:hypothetical protein
MLFTGNKERKRRDRKKCPRHIPKLNWLIWWEKRRNVDSDRHIYHKSREDTTWKKKEKMSKTNIFPYVLSVFSYSYLSYSPFWQQNCAFSSVKNFYSSNPIWIMNICMHPTKKSTVDTHADFHSKEMHWDMTRIVCHLSTNENIRTFQINKQHIKYNMRKFLISIEMNIL